MTSSFFSKRAAGHNSTIGKPYFQGLRQKFERAQSRRKLLDLDERLLQDIGLTRNDVINGNF